MTNPVDLLPIPQEAEGLLNYLQTNFRRLADIVEQNESTSSATNVPVGGIVMWSGAIADIPANWALCDGTAGTPDLRNRFVVGAGGAYAEGATGGAETVTLTEAQMPAHSHGTVDGDGLHYTPSTGTSHDHSAFGVGESSGSNTGYRAYMVNNWESASKDIDIGNSGSHKHQLLVNGSSQSHENRPPYYALAYIMRVS